MLKHPRHKHQLVNTHTHTRAKSTTRRKRDISRGQLEHTKPPYTRSPPSPARYPDHTHDATGRTEGSAKITFRAARVINADGEKAAAETLAQAAEILAKTQGAINLRTLNTLERISTEPSQKTMMLFPIELIDAIRGNKK